MQPKPFATLGDPALRQFRNLARSPDPACAVTVILSLGLPPRSTKNIAPVTWDDSRVQMGASQIPRVAKARSGPDGAPYRCQKWRTEDEGGWLPLQPYIHQSGITLRRIFFELFHTLGQFR